MSKISLALIPSYVPEDMIMHVVPIDDLREHDCVRDECWCSPEVDEEGIGFVVIHRSLDGRERFMPGKKH